jgi:hypothetical protein
MLIGGSRLTQDTNADSPDTLCAVILESWRSPGLKPWQTFKMLRDNDPALKKLHRFTGGSERDCTLWPVVAI